MRSASKCGLLSQRCVASSVGEAAPAAGKEATRSQPPGAASPAVTKLLLSPAEAAAALGVGRTTLYGLLSSGALASVRIGALRRIPLGALERYLATLGEASGIGEER